MQSIFDVSTNNQKSRFIYFCFISVACFPDFPDFIEYRIAFAPILIVWIINLERISIPLHGMVNVMPLVLSLAWFYGLLLGLYHQNGIDTFYNYFGMSLFVVALVLDRTNICYNQIYKMVLFGGLFQSLYQYLYFVEKVGSVGAFFQRNFEGIQSFRVHYSVGLIYSIASIALLISAKRYRVDLGYFHKFRYILVPMMMISILITGSKGYFLATFITLAIFSLGNTRTVISLVIKLTIIIIIGYNIWSADVMTALIASYDFDEISNAVRNEQLLDVKNEWSLLGKGLGAGLNSGYIRGDEKYGLELTYHSIIHKLGYIAGGLVVVLLVYLYLKAILDYLVCRKLTSLVALSLMSCLIPAYGNPSLFSPYSVLAILLSIVLMRNNLKSNIDLPIR